jgi:hypothetical protein
MKTGNLQELFIEIFKSNHLKKDAKTVSIETLLSDRYLKRIKYDPYYQRNYIWEKDKQSFFIESVILGTEIPPLVFFKSGMQTEVIDGRQRFETLKRFKEDDFSLSISGLLELQALSKKTFSRLNEDIQRIFLNTKIRIFEFEIVGIPDLDPMVEDKIKKEIFRRYNSGITPLKQSEVDNAKYDSEDLSDYFKEKLRTDKSFYNILNRCFFKNSDKAENELIADMVALLRKLLVLDSFPITRYADSGKTLILDLLYDNYIENIRENEDLTYEMVAEKIINQIKDIGNNVNVENRFIYECLIWGIRILDKEGISFNLKENSESINEHYKKNIQTYSTDNDHYYGNIVTRFNDTGLLLNCLTNCDFSLYIRTPEFKNRLTSLRQTEKDAELTMDKLADLRLNKPAPASKPIAQVIRDVSSNYYLIRPSYQRQEKISVRKASSIIESLLLGIKLPPLFIYVRKDGVREVIDGQQRLLSIIGFLGQSYINEEGKKTYSKNYSFSLKDLRILKEHNGKKYSDIISKVEDLILDFDIDEIEISQDLNEQFEPTDLFIRLNNKPYPIKQNTFEMWNSTVDKDVIQKIKEVTGKYVSWFYIKAPEMTGDKKDRMQNEELITILSYLSYNHLKHIDIKSILGFYPRLEKFTCRLKTKSNLTDILESFELKPSEKEFFLRSIQQTENIIITIKEILLENDATKDSFNTILNIKQLQRFSRSNQELYIIWIILNDIPKDLAISHRQEVLTDIRKMLSSLKNIEERAVNDNYVEEFHSKMKSITDKYKNYMHNEMN